MINEINDKIKQIQIRCGYVYKGHATDWIEFKLKLVNSYISSLLSNLKRNPSEGNTLKAQKLIKNLEDILKSFEKEQQKEAN